MSQLDGAGPQTYPLVPKQKNHLKAVHFWEFTKSAQKKYPSAICPILGSKTRCSWFVLNEKN